MKAFIAMVHREFHEHRGGFLYAPLVLVAVLFGCTILAFTVGRVDSQISGTMFAVSPMRIYEIGFLCAGVAWGLYLLASLFFYCADGFAADRRNNAMLFWKSMPLSDFTVLLSKLTAAITIFPGLIFAITLLSGLLLFGVAIVTSAMAGGDAAGLIGNVIAVYVNVGASLLVTLAIGLLWYLPFIALVGALATVVGRWAIPLTALLPVLISMLEWVSLGRGLNPFGTQFWSYFWYRTDFPFTEGYLESWLIDGSGFDFGAYALDLVNRTDWLQIAYGAAFAIICIYAASQYRRRSNAG